MKFLKKNWLLILILLIGAICRLYKIGEYMTFLGDEGRDAIVVRNLLTKLDPILIGPGTSVGGMYLGPLYYYLIAPFLLFANMSPIGPSIGVALFGVATIYLVYLIGKDWFSEKVGLIAASLYAISPTVIVYSRSSWNPNIMPFFAALAVYSIWKVYKEEKYKWLIVVAISISFILQSHYLGFLLMPLLGGIYLLTVLGFRKKGQTGKKKNLREFVIYSLISLGLIVFLLITPLVLFDLRHDFLNSRAIYKFLTVRQETVSIRPWNAIPRAYPIFTEINTSLLTAKNILVGKLTSLLLGMGLLVFILKKNLKFKSLNPLGVIVVWLGLAILGFGLYKQHIYDHYFGFMFPVPFLLLGLVLEKIFESKFKLLGYLVFIFLIGVNIVNNPLRFSPNRQMQRAENVAQRIIELSGGSSFNFAVIAERNYEDGYQYFLERSNSKIVEIDAQIPETVQDQLFVVCEMQEEKCDPTHSSKAEVANFGWSKVEATWREEGVVIYKLVHSK